MDRPEKEKMLSSNEHISEILNGLKIYDGVYKKELIETSIEVIQFKS